MTQIPPWLENHLSPHQVPHASDMGVFAALLAGSRDIIATVGTDGRFTLLSQAGAELLEIGGSAAPNPLDWDQLWSGPSLPAAQEALAAARAGSKGIFCAPRADATGKTRFWDVLVIAIPAPLDQPQRLLAIMHDATQAWRSQQERQAHTAELNHRMKNQMAVVQSIVNQTLRGAYAPEIAKKMIATRLDALAHAHDLLMHSEEERAPLHRLVEVATRSLDSRRVLASGPPLVLEPKAALSLSLILHELASNAVLHGALSVPEGRIEISWAHAQLDGAPAFELHFSEKGGPLVSPPSAKGFGTRLVQGGLSGSASQANLDFHPEGVQFRLVAVLMPNQNTLG